MPDAQCHRCCALNWCILLTNGLQIWIQHKKISKPRNFHQFWRRSWPLKGQKTPKMCPLCHFLDTQEPVLGESTFEGGNDLQIRKFKVFQKLDRQGFPTSYRGPDLDEWKPTKSILEAALCIKLRALRIRQIFANFAKKLRILPSLTIS